MKSPYSFVVANTLPYKVIMIYEGELFEVEPHGRLPLKSVERLVSNKSGIEITEVILAPTKEGWDEIKTLSKDVVIIGCPETSRAYRGRVVIPVVVPGYEDLPHDKKVYRTDKFAIIR